MKYKLDNSRNEMQRANTIIIYIGLNRYRLVETDEELLSVNKMSDGVTDEIKVIPVASNIIRID